VTRVFGTDGIRGRANRGPLTPQAVVRACFHAGRLLARRGRVGPVVIGRDTRASGGWLAAAAAAGFCSAGRDVLDGGVLPTPAVSVLVRKERAALGLVVSASHNPAADNGLKFFAEDGGKADDDFERDLEDLLDVDPSEEQEEFAGTLSGSIRPWPEAEGLYLDQLAHDFQGLSLKGLRILFDGAHGAAYRTTPALLRRLGAEVECAHCEPDGLNINERCGALHPDSLRRRVKAEGFDLGVLHDGDADRGFLVTRDGALLDGEDFLLALATAPDPRPAKVVGTVMCNLGLETALKEAGIELVRAAVGDRNVSAGMTEHDAPVGAEPSGHVIVARLGPTGDGLASCLAVLESLGCEAEEVAEALAALPERWSRYPQVLRNVAVQQKPPLEEIEGWGARHDEVAERLGDAGRILVRYSGTEPKVRVMVEAATQDDADGAAEELARFLEEVIG
jgi:phosphoglucosamine mutase